MENEKERDLEKTDLELDDSEQKISKFTKNVYNHVIILIYTIIIFDLGLSSERIWEKHMGQVAELSIIFQPVVFFSLILMSLIFTLTINDILFLTTKKKN